MPIVLDDTIAAVASPPGPAERGIIRISGPDVRSVVEAVFCPLPSDAAAGSTSPGCAGRGGIPGETSDGGEISIVDRHAEIHPSRAAQRSGRGRPEAGGGPDLESSTASPDWRAARRPARFQGSAYLPSLGVPLPVDLCYWPTHRSFTGQPVAELHTISSAPLLDALLERICECGARPARRGEFTMRAFLAGRIDLLQAEAIMGVIDATDHEELKQALSQLGGGLTERLAGIRAELIAMLGDLEAGLDFVEEDIEFITADEIVRRLSQAIDTLSLLLQDSDERLPSGWRPRIVLAGLPNAGKSTLFNRLAGSDKAIVSSVPGTTRDYLSAQISLGTPATPLDVELIDTAGCEDAADLIMERAQRTGRELVFSGDLVVWCRSAVLSQREQQADESQRSLLQARDIRLLTVLTQVDRSLDESPERMSQQDRSADLRISVHKNRGVDELQRTLIAQLKGQNSGRGELLASTAARCRDSLRRTITALESARQSAQAASGDELTALDIHDALHELGVILGFVCTDDILDHIFSRFCIGK